MPNDKVNEIIKDHGFYDEKGIWNSIITFSGDDHIYRERVETIIVKNDKEVFYKLKPSGEYFLPGGSTEKGLSHIEQAVNEVHEEAMINIRNIKYSGITYKKVLDHIHNANVITWDALYNEVYVAEYDSNFKGEVDEEDKDSFIKSGKFYPIKEAMKIFRKEHREALLWYLKEKDKEDNEEEEVTEGYLSNYFANRKILKKIGKSPEIARDGIKDVIKLATDKYNELKNTSKVRRLKQNKKELEATFFPVANIDFPDNHSVTISVSFDESKSSPGMAFYSDSCGDICCLYPSFFEYKDPEAQIFVILHELGHIRLGHCNDVNNKILGISIDNNKMRSRSLRKNKVVYPEVNADLYAMLNGAQLYTLFKLGYDKDVDEKYDYRFTNAELSNRYSNVWDKYKKISKYYESDINNSLSTYDIYCMSLYEMVYDNYYTKNLSEKDKSNLYNLLYSFAIPSEYKEKCDEILIERADVGQTTFYGKNDRVGKIMFEKTQAKKCILENAIKIHNKLAYEYIVGRHDYKNYCYLIESLTKAERDEIDTNDFGIKSERKYPLDTKDHVISAIRLFGHCEPRYEKELAHNIIKAMNKYNIDKSMIGKSSRLYKYI